MIKYKEVTLGILGIVGILTILFPIIDGIFHLMNQKSDLFYFGPILLIAVGIVYFKVISNLINYIKKNLN
jgi:hypothetical protein